MLWSRRGVNCRQINTICDISQQPATRSLRETEEKCTVAFWSEVEMSVDWHGCDGLRQAVTVCQFVREEIMLQSLSICITSQCSFSSNPAYSVTGCWMHCWVTVNLGNTLTGQGKKGYLFLFTVNVLHAWTLGDVRFQYSCEWFVNEFDWHAFATRLKDKDHVSNNRIIQLKISRSNDWKLRKFL